MGGPSAAFAGALLRAPVLLSPLFLVGSLRMYREIAAASDGAYDPTIAPLVGLWGFGAGGGEDRRVPDDAAVANALARTGWRRIVFDALDILMTLLPDPAARRREIFRLHEWLLATRWWHEMVGQPGGTGGIDDAFTRLHDVGIGAEIMGARKFGPPGWHEDPEWKGAWGPNPPFHTPVFVLTHHTRPSIEMEGGTTFHFIDASPAEALETAREAADGQDVRIGGGATVIRDFVAAGLVDHLHVVVVPILLGRGVRLWDGLEGLEADYEIVDEKK